MKSLKEFTKGDINLLRVPLQHIGNDFYTGNPVYKNDSKYIERNIFDIAEKIRRLVILINNKPKNLSDIIAQYYVTELTEDEAKVIDLVFPNLSKKIEEAEKEYNRIQEEFYEGLL